MTLEGIKSGLAKYTEIQRITQPKNISNGQAAQENGTSFSSALGNALKEVNNLQVSANDKIEDLLVRRDETTTHEALIALEQADVAFQLMNNIRAKIIRAYEEVMRTQI